MPPSLSPAAARSAAPLPFDRRGSRARGLRRGGATMVAIGVALLGTSVAFGCTSRTVACVVFSWLAVVGSLSLLIGLVAWGAGYRLSRPAVVDWALDQGEQGR